MAMPRKKCRKKTKLHMVVAVLVALLMAGGAVGYGVWKGYGRNPQSVAGDSHTASAGGTARSVNSDSRVTYNGKEYVYNEHLSNFLFAGIDNREKEATETGKADAGQADAIFLLSWDRVTGEITGISIPRDTMTEIEVFDQEGNSAGKSVDHINLAYAYGDGGRESCQLLEEAVSNLLYGIPIQGYCSINMDGIPVLVEQVGSVTVTVPDESLEDVDPQWCQGAQVELTPENVEEFVRYRDTEVSQSAISRMERQQIFLKAYAQKAQETFERDRSFVTKLYEALDSYMVTNIGNEQFVKIMESGQQGASPKTWTLPGEGTQGDGFDEYHVDDSILYEKIIETFYEEVKN